MIAFNILGDSPGSNHGTGAVMPVTPTFPSAPQALIRNELTTTMIQVGFNWSAPASNGNAPILDYYIIWDQGISSYMVASTSVTSQTYIRTSLTPGTTYKF